MPRASDSCAVIPRFWRGRSASIRAAVELAAVRAWSRTNISAWPALRLAGGTVVEVTPSPGLVAGVVAPGLAGSGPGLAGSRMVFSGTGISLVSGAVVGVTVVGGAVVGGTVVVVSAGATVVVVVAGGTIWARPAVEPPKREKTTAVMPRRGVRGVLIRT